MPGHSEPKQLTAPVTDDNERKQAFECRRVNHAQIDRCDRVRVIAQKRSPGLRRWPAMADHILGDRRLGDLEPKLEQFTVDAGRTPEPAGATWLARQITGFPWGRDRAYGKLLAPGLQNNSNLFQWVDAAPSRHATFISSIRVRVGKSGFQGTL